MHGRAILEKEGGREGGEGNGTLNGNSDGKVGGGEGKIVPLILGMYYVMGTVIRYDAVLYTNKAKLFQRSALHPSIPAIRARSSVAAQGCQPKHLPSERADLTRTRLMR